MAGYKLHTFSEYTDIHLLLGGCKQSSEAVWGEVPELSSIYIKMVKKVK
jgi:hypothetical protein